MEKNGIAFLISILFNALIYVAAYRKKSVHLKTSSICVRKSEMFKIMGITLLKSQSCKVQSALKSPCSKGTDCFQHFLTTIRTV